MKYQNESLGSKTDSKDYLRDVFNQFFAGNLVVEGQNVLVPDGQDLEAKVKYTADEDGNSLAIKISWDNASEEAID